jgi:signal transduction histidine kinase
MPKTDAGGPEIQPFIVSTLPPTAAQVRVALGVLSGIVAIVAIATGPLSHWQTSPAPAVLPMYVTTMIVTDCLTAVLLLAQFVVLRSRAIIVIATGYAFAALVLIPYLLTFPGLFGVAGSIAGPLSTAWFFVLWRSGFPLFVIGYALVKSADAGQAEWRGTVAGAVGISVGVAAGLVGAGVLLHGLSRVYVPEEFLEGLSASALYPYYVGYPVLVMSTLAVVVLWLRRSSTLDLWLMVVMCLFAMEVPLSFWPNPARFSISWYTFRGIGVLASSVILILLLFEITTLHIRLLRSINAQRREREARLLTGDAVAAAIAHEVRQPLTAIVASAGAALRFLDRPEPVLNKAIESLTRIASDGHRADAIVESVRATFKNRVRERRPVDVNGIVLEALAFEHDDLRAHKIVVQVAPATQLPEVRGDRIQLQQVLINLIANAIHAMAASDGPRILSVRSEACQEGGVMVSVADTGRGINQLDTTRIFNPLFTTKADGMGMGLAICRSIIETHDGRLWVTRNSPEGAVFQFTLGGNDELSTSA